MSSGALPDEMTAAVLHGPNDVRIEKVPLPPRPGPLEVMCRVRAISICGTDPGIVAGKFFGKPPHWPPKYPFIIGHEWAGEIVAVGEGVEPDSKVGDRVCAEAHKGCGFCQMCLRGRYNLCVNYGKLEKGHRHYGFTAQGGYAEYVTIHVKSLHKMPPTMSFDEGAMIDTASIALHGCQRVRISPGDTVAVLGTGPVGLSCIQIARTMGATRVIASGRGIRLEVAKELGASDALDYRGDDPVERIKDLTGGGVDVSIEAAGKVDAAKQAIDCVRRGGRVALIGLYGWIPLTYPPDRIVLDDLEVHGIRGNPNTADETVRMIASGNIDVKPLITHTFPLTDFDRALDTFVNRLEGCIKVVLHP